MRQIGASLAIMLTVVSVSYAAEVVEIPLPELEGRYWQQYPDSSLVAERTTTVTLPSLPLAIYRVWFSVRGTAEVGEYVCTIGDPGPHPWFLDLYASMRDDAGEWWFAYEQMPEQSGLFDWTAEFEAFPTSPASWDFLLDGEAALRVWGAPIGMVVACSGTPPAPTALVEEVILHVEGDFTVQVESSSWGSLKNLYR